MRTAELDYHLPPDLIAQVPAEPRDAARLLVARRRLGTVEHRRVADLLEFLRPDDVVVVNRTRVRPARLRGRRPTGGAVEVLLLEPRSDGTWEALARPARRLRPGATIEGPHGLVLHVEGRLDGGRLLLRPVGAEPLDRVLEAAGEVPLPPYIRTPIADPDRYQTVYAQEPGSAAAPTAGLHFSPALWAGVERRCTVAAVELRIGLDTFRPVEADDLDGHPMHSEAYRVDSAVRGLLVAARDDGRRIVAVGTTAVRVLETIADPAAPDAGRTALKIQPGHRFRLVDALLTNFHLPRSTLLALVMAFAGEDRVRDLYRIAVRERYRFYSFGDAMFLADD
jgi:S-adenosylmethionine:tRNA ribosyltransferase-isomerase